jgi:hypothetical protein
MAKLLAVKCSLIVLQLVSLLMASVIIIVYYNPWIKILIDSADDVSETGDKLVEQFRGIEGEEIVIFIMCLATIVVSVLGVMGALRGGHHHNHCLLNFYVTTLIIFLFVTFVALCGTIWELINKLLNRTSFNDYLFDDRNTGLQRTTEEPAVHTDSALNASVSTPAADFDLILEPSPPLMTSWWYITKSFLFILISATIYATSIKLTRKILDSDDHYLEADDDSGRHFNIDNDDDGVNPTTKDSSFTRV